MTKFVRFVKDESGATAIEYGLIAALIALAIMVGAGVGTLASTVNPFATGVASDAAGDRTRASWPPNCALSGMFSCWPEIRCES